MIQDIENLMNKVQAMRQKQREYSKRKNDVVKRQVTEQEKAVDELLIQLRKKGYNPENQDPKYSQKHIF